MPPEYPFCVFQETLPALCQRHPCAFPRKQPAVHLRLQVPHDLADTLGASYTGALMPSLCFFLYDRQKYLRILNIHNPFAPLFIFLRLAPPRILRPTLPGTPAQSRTYPPGEVLFPPAHPPPEPPRTFLQNKVPSPSHSAAPDGCP